MILSRETMTQAKYTARVFGPLKPGEKKTGIDTDEPGVLFVTDDVPGGFWCPDEFVKDVEAQHGNRT